MNNKYIFLISILILIIYLYYCNNIDHLTQIEMINYFNHYNLNFIEMNDIYIYTLMPNMHQNLKYITYSNNIIYYNLNNNKNKNWQLFDVIDKNKYDIFSIKFIENIQTIVYYFNINNPSFLIQSWTYGEFIVYGNIKNKSIINISDSTSNVFSAISNLLNDPNLYIINNNVNLTNKSYYFFGFVPNVGHHLWNELSGLINFLNTKSNLEKISGIIFGSHDYFNMYSFIKKKYNIPVLKFNEIYPDANSNLINLDIIPFFLPSFMIDPKYYIPLFHELNPIKKIEKNTKILEICIDIRVKERIFKNCDIFYSRFINDLYNKYKVKIKIYFTGVFKLNSDINMEEVKLQNDIVNNITKSINTNITVENLINQDFYSIRDKILNVNLSIATFGTCVANLLNWIYNFKSIHYGLKSWYPLINDIQYNCLHNYNVNILPIDYIINVNELNTFDINYDLFYEFMIKNIRYNLN